MTPESKAVPAAVPTGGVESAHHAETPGNPFSRALEAATPGVGPGIDSAPPSVPFTDPSFVWRLVSMGMSPRNAALAVLALEALQAVSIEQLEAAVDRLSMRPPEPLRALGTVLQCARDVQRMAAEDAAPANT